MSVIADKLKAPGGQAQFDLIIIGGGINGTGIAREACLRGLSVLLVEKHDLGTGTTAGSTRLIHGGLRYLETLEFGLVRESLRERQALLKNAPHLVHALPLGIPFYKRPKARPAWLIRAGMMLYDLLSWDKELPNHRALNAVQFAEEFRGVDLEGLQGGVVYYDAQLTFPERLCVENILAAGETQHCVVMTHTQLLHLTTTSTGSITQAQGITCQDRLTGKYYQADGKLIINAAGPWVDTLNAELNTKRRIGGTKGTHVIVRRFAGGPQQALYTEAKSNGRPYFIVPWQQDFYLIGTTDDPYPENPDQARPLSSEVDYLLSETNAILPQARLTRDKVLYAYTGIRPLPWCDAQSPGKITRRHFIVDHAQDPRFPILNLFSLVGGKLTTSRQFAQEVIEAGIQKGFFHSKDSRLNTTQLALPGGRGMDSLERYKAQYASILAVKYQISEECVNTLIERYGSQATTVLALTEDNPQLKTQVLEHPVVLAVEIAYVIETEKARTLGDIMRRLTLNWNAALGLDVVAAIAQAAGQYWAWSSSEIDEALEAYRQEVSLYQLAPLTKNPMPSVGQALNPATA